MSPLRGPSQNREGQESCPEDTRATLPGQRLGAAKARLRLTGLLLALVTLLVYLPVCHYGFVVYDDDDYVTQNHVVRNGLTWAGVRWAFTTWQASNWHPVTWLSHMLDCQWFGLNAGAHHSVNLMFHAANAVLLLALLFRLTNALWPSALVAALFAWHPLHVESVAWIAERKDVLSTFFGLLALLAYVRYAQKRSRVDPTAAALGSRPRTLDYAVALLCFALALMSKPMLVTLPLVMLLLDFWPLQRLSRSSLGRLLLEKCPFFLLTAAACVVTYLAQSAHGGGAVIPLRDYPLDLRLDNALVAYGRYLLQTVWPVNLAVIYPLFSHWAGMRAVAASMVLMLGAVSWLAWRQRRPYPWLLVGWLWFLGTLVPVIGLVQVGGQAIADRYTYLPLVGLFIAVVFSAREWLKQARVGPVVPAAGAGLVLAACLALTARQVRYWQDSETLFAHAVAVTKENDTAHLNLGVALEQKKKPEAALAEYRQALRLNPESAQAYNNIANLLQRAGHTNEALAGYQASIRFAPGQVAARLNLGMLLVDLGRFDAAMRIYQEAARRDPNNPQPPYLMGQALLHQGRDLEALARLREALRLDPADIHMLTYVARVLAADENAQVRNGPIALAMAAKANDLTGNAQPAMLDTVAMAYAEMGGFREAQQAEERAIQLANAAGFTNDAAAMQQRLKLYENGQPYRQSFTNGLPKNLMQN